MCNKDEDACSRAGNVYCYYCGTEMIWGCDFTLEDYGLDGIGMVATFSCPNEECEATAEFATAPEKDDEGNIIEREDE